MPTVIRLGGGGGVTNSLIGQLTATSSQVLNGYKFVGSGTKEIQTGSMINRSVIDSTIGAINTSYPNTPIHVGANQQMGTGTVNGTKYLCIGVPTGYWPGTGNAYVGIAASSFGDAGSGDVLASKKFTSSNGINLTGTIVDRGNYQTGGGLGSANLGTDNGYIAINLIPAGYYHVTNSSYSSWAPEVRLPASEFGNASTADVLAGKTFTSYHAQCGAGTIATAVNDGTHIDFNGATGFMTSESGTRQLTLHDNDNIIGKKYVSINNPWLRFPASLFGTATAAQVKSGITFTSSEGLKLTGTGTILDVASSGSNASGYNISVTNGCWYAIAVHHPYVGTGAASISSGLSNVVTAHQSVYEMNDSNGTYKGGGHLTLFIGKATAATVSISMKDSYGKITAIRIA